MIQVIQASSISGNIQAPASKSVVQRAVAASLLCNGESILNGYTPCDDSIVAIKIIENLGATVIREDGQLNIKACSPLFQTSVPKSLNCGESGLSSRLFAPLSLLFSNNIELTGDGSLLQRSFTNMEAPFKQLGVQYRSNNNLLPIHLTGQIKPGHIELDGSGGSQFLSGLLMTLPLLNANSLIEVKKLKSKAYIDLTIEVLKAFNINIEHQNYEVFNIEGNQKYIACQYTIEGDWSGASCLLVAGAIAGSVEIAGLNAASKQADRSIIELLKMAGSTVVENSNLVKIIKAKLKAFNFDASHCPDLFPALVVLAANGDGISSIAGVSRLRNKESNRALTLQSEFANIGIRVEIEDDTILVHGGVIKGGEVYSHNDHRIAMAMAVAGLTAQMPLTINGADCVNKSYPNFFDDLKLLQNI